MKVIFEIINELDTEEFWMIYVILVLVALIVVNPIVTRLCNMGKSNNKEETTDINSEDKAIKK